MASVALDLLAELLDLAIDEEVVSRVQGWYVPVTLFHQLRLLTPAERKAFKTVVREGASPASTHLQPFPAERRIVLLDGLLAYQHYRLIAAKSEARQRVREIKDRILSARLQLPARPALEPIIPVLPSPAEGSRPMAFGAGMAIGDDERPFLRLTWSPFKKERVGHNSLEGDELVVCDLAVGAFEDERDVFLDQLDLIRIFKLNTRSVPIAGEHPFSWGVRAGVSRVEDEGEDRYDGLVSFGAGYAWPWHRRLASYAMLDLAAHTLDPLVRVRPHVALQSDMGALRTWAYVGAASASYDGDVDAIWGGKLQYALTPRCALQIEWTNEQATRASVGLTWSW